MLLPHPGGIRIEDGMGLDPYRYDPGRTNLPESEFEALQKLRHADFDQPPRFGFTTTLWLGIGFGFALGMVFGIWLIQG